MSTEFGADERELCRQGINAEHPAGSIEGG